MVNTTLVYKLGIKYEKKVIIKRKNNRLLIYFNLQPDFKMQIFMLIKNNSWLLLLALILAHKKKIMIKEFFFRTIEVQEEEEEEKSKS
jgi:hypothetical protein